MSNCYSDAYCSNQEICRCTPPAPTCIGTNSSIYNIGDIQPCTSSANSCGVTNTGTQTCQANGTWSSCSASTPADPANLGQSCTSASNSCGQTNTGTIQCDSSCSATTPANPASLGQPCASAPNNCGDTNPGTITCSGSCSATPPPNRASCVVCVANQGASCTSAANSCGQTNTGIIQCNGSCSATTPSDPSNLGQSCTSAPNSCSQTSTGTITCTGVCSATTPPNASCPPSPGGGGGGASCGPLTACTAGGSTVCCVYGCDATDPSGCAVAPGGGGGAGVCTPGTTQACSSPTNACGSSNLGVRTCTAGGVWSSCSASTPSNPANLNQPCTSAPNNCGDTNTGIITCTGSCSAIQPPNRASCVVCVPTAGQVCTSAPNSCGMTNTGAIQCNGTCNAVTPSNALCSTGGGAATISAALSASPVQGPAPLTTTLTASVTTADHTSTLNYSFFYNCTYAGSSVAQAQASCGALPAPVPGSCVANTVGVKCDAMSAAAESVSASYASQGARHPLVIVEQGSASPVSARTTVSVLPPSAGVVQPSCTVTASPTTILKGQTSQIAWSCTNTTPTTACTLNGTPVGSTGSTAVSPATTTSYLLSCTNDASGHTPPAQALITVTVSANPGLKEVAP